MLNQEERRPNWLAGVATKRTRHRAAQGASSPQKNVLDADITPVVLTRMKTAISIPDPLFKAAERMAERFGISRSELFRRAIREFLGNHENRGVTEALNEVYGSEHETVKLDELLERMQASSILEEEW